MTHEDELAMVRRHVTEGERHVARQREIVGELQAGGHDTGMAVKLLEDFENLLGQHRAHLDRLTASLRGSPPPATA